MRPDFFRLLPFSFVALTAGIASCSAEGAVSLTGSLGNVSVVVEEQLLVSTASGGFDVYLELGERASDATDVSFSAFSLVRADTGALVCSCASIGVVASKATPIRIQPGDSTTIRFEIGDQAQPGGSVAPMELDKDDFASICGAGPVKIVGTMQDSANGQRSTSLASTAFTPSGC